MSDTTYPAEKLEALITCDGIGKAGKLKLLRAHVAAEVAKATGELLKDKERLDWLNSQPSFSFGRCLSAPENHDAPAFALSVGLFTRKRHFPASSFRAAIDAARAQQKDTP